MKLSQLTFLERKAYYMSRKEFVMRGYGTAQQWNELRKSLALRAIKNQSPIPNK